MKKKWIAVLLGVCMVMGLTGCGGEAKPLYEVNGKEAQKLELPVAQELDETLKTGVNQFAYRFYEEMASSENMFFSPYSICGALSLLDVGAGGETKKELEELLGISDLDAWNGQMKLYMEKEQGEKMKLLTANSLWIAPYMNRSENIETEFLQPAAFYYKSEVFEANFADEGEAVVAAVNKWVDKKTEGMIPKYKDEVDSGLVMMILNAVYFEGKWNQPFKAEDTVENRIFTNSQGQKRENISMMYQWDTRFRYMETEAWKGIELPYKDSSIVMDILLPADEESVHAIGMYQAMGAEEKEKIWQSFENAPFEKITCLAMPRFTMDLQVPEMDTILKNMGMLSAFSPDADFDSIGKDVYVSAVSHRAKLEVDEEGTKASAVTEISMEEGAAIETETEVIEFIMDRPFIFVIRDTDTGMILFMGQTADLEINL